MDFEDHKHMETKIVHPRAHHGFDFPVNLYNYVSVSHFGCPNWEALCEAYDFDEGLLVTMDLGDPDIEEDNMNSWVLIDTLPILLLCEFLKHSY